MFAQAIDSQAPEFAPGARWMGSKAFPQSEGRERSKALSGLLRAIWAKS